MAQAERVKVEAWGHEWTYPGHVLANPDPMDRLAQVEAWEEAERREDPEAYARSLADRDEAKDEYGRLREAEDAARDAALDAILEGPLHDERGVPKFPPDILEMDGHPQEAREELAAWLAFDGREGPLVVGDGVGPDEAAAREDRFLRFEQEQAERQAELDERVAEAERETGREEEAEREVELGPEGEDWLDAIIDDALAEGRTARDRQRSRGHELGD